MEIDDIVLSFGQFYDEDADVLIGSADVNEVQSTPFSENFPLMMNFEYNLYNLGYYPDNYLDVSDLISDEDYHIFLTLDEVNPDVFEKSSLICILSNKRFEAGYDSYENERLIIIKFLEYLKFLKVDYLVLNVNKARQMKTKSKVKSFPKHKLYEELGFKQSGLSVMYKEID